jgi:DNA-binding NtrC family response regulator
MNASPAAGICLLEDDPIMGESLTEFFRLENLRCDWFRTVASARTALLTENYQAFVSDIRLPDGDGGALFRELVEIGSSPPATVFITGYGSVPHAVELLNRGARDYLTKPFEPDELVGKLRRAAPSLFDRGTATRMRQLGISPAMHQIEHMLERVARHRVPVLITGESGVGKEFAARYLHDCRHPTERAPFLAINCAAVPHDLIEAELFGAEKGAFTGAFATRRGLFEQAGRGTLLLDEAGEMPLPMQAKLLRAVQERHFRRVGGSEDIPLEADLVWATNRHLATEVAAGRFREDLYFRIGAIQVDIPPLRDRPSDILWFAERFLEVFLQENGRPFILSPSAARHLEAQAWPGNVRELKQAIERAAIFSDTGFLDRAHFLRPVATAVTTPDSDAPTGLRHYLDECERAFIRHALDLCAGRAGDSANLLGISRKSLWERMQRLGIDRASTQRRIS